MGDLDKDTQQLTQITSGNGDTPSPIRRMEGTTQTEGERERVETKREPSPIMIEWNNLMMCTAQFQVDVS